MDHLEYLLKFANEIGVVIPQNVEFRDTKEKGICCIATTDIDGALFKLPREFIITKDLSNTHFKDFIGSSKHHNTWFKLFLSKLKFSDEAIAIDGVDVTQRFRPYINALPKQVDSPLIWNPSELLLLNGTNIYRSLNEKLQSIYDEWWNVIKDSGFKTETYDISQLSIDEIYREITSKVSSDVQLNFDSFPAFLWAHLICTSRAFPERVINPSCEEHNIILLPVLDLLNHENRSKIQWSYSAEKEFVFEKLDVVKKGSEICNNYGAKGNEELLWGYGFVIEQNQFDNLALKLKLPVPVVERLLHEQEIRLPTFKDYTTYAFDVSNKAQIPTEENQLSNASDYEDGILYFINSEIVSLKPLIELFAQLNKNAQEDPKTLRCQLTSLQSLKNALQHKLLLITNPQAETTRDLENHHEVNSYRRYCAEVYKTSQIDILRQSINNVKRLQKQILSEYKPSVASIKNIIKRDKTFYDDLAQLYGNKEPIALTDEFDLSIAWLMVRNYIPFSSEEPKKYEWVIQMFKNYMETHNSSCELTEAGTTLHSSFFPSGNDDVSPKVLEHISNFVNYETFLMESGDDAVPVFTQPATLEYD